MSRTRPTRPLCLANAWLALTITMLVPGCSCASAHDAPVVELEALPQPLSSGQEVLLALRVSGLPGDSVEAELITVFADRAVARRTLEVALDGGHCAARVRFVAPRVKERVPVSLVAKVCSDGQVCHASSDSEILPRWGPRRLGDVLRNRTLGIVDPDGIVAAALGEVVVEGLSWGDPLGIRGYRGDLIICHLPDYSPLPVGLAEALLDRLRNGTSVLWLSASSGRRPALIRHGELVEVDWPFALRPGVELPLIAAGDLDRWAGGDRPLPPPLEAAYAEARLVVCSDPAVLHLADEPAAGWLWESLLARAMKPTVDSPDVKRLAPNTELHALRVAREPVVGVLDLKGEEWLSPDEEHIEWLHKLAFEVSSGARVVVTGAGAERLNVLQALLGQAVDFATVQGSPDVLLAPNLLLWGLGSRDPQEGLLVREGGEPLISSYLRGDTSHVLFGEFRLGKGVILLSQVDFDESARGAQEGFVDHVARQIGARARVYP